MPEILRYATAIVGLLLAAIAAYKVWRNRPPDRLLMIGTVVLELFVIALAISGIVHLASGHRTHELATFIGYLVAFVIVPPAGFLLARLEPTKWGSVIIGAVGLVEAILVVRLQQVLTGVG